MLNVSSAPYRRFCRKVSDKVGLVIVPMLYTKRLEKNPSSVELDLYRINEERPIGVQLIGSNIDALKKSIEFLESYEFDLLDINAGCPSKRALNANEGGYLMNDLETLSHLIQSALKYSSRPVSLKIRTGFEKPVDVNEFISMIDNLGLEFITIHGRTVKDRFYKTKIDLGIIKKIKENLSIPVIGNGEIIDIASAKNFLESTSVDGLMIGRGSIGNPEIFTQIDKFLENGTEISTANNIIKWENYIKLYEECIDDYLDEENPIEYQKEKFKFTEMCRNSIWLTKNIKDSTGIRRNLSRAKNMEQLRCFFKEVIQVYNF